MDCGNLRYLNGEMGRGSNEKMDEGYSVPGRSGRFTLTLEEMLCFLNLLIELDLELG